MIYINCAVCSIHYFVGTGSITALHNTDDGPVAELSCPAGHALIHRFRTSDTTPVAA